MIYIAEVELPKGTLLKGRYVVERSLGSGGFGITYLCMDNVVGEYVAVKEYFPKLAVREGLNLVIPRQYDIQEHYTRVESFLDESKIASKFVDVRIVRQTDSFRENSTAYYVMEYVEGPTLVQFIRSNGPLKAQEAVRIAEEISLGLRSIHDAGFVHGDLKPTNVILKNERAVKITDFGGASMRDSFFMPLHAGVVSLHYSAPERFVRCIMPTAQSDIYSLGGVLFFLVSGLDPVPAPDRLKGIAMADPPTNYRLRRVIRKAMAMAMSDRYQDILQLIRALRKRLF